MQNDWKRFLLGCGLLVALVFPTLQFISEEAARERAELRQRDRVALEWRQAPRE